jgi:hypothetical protein
VRLATGIVHVNTAPVAYLVVGRSLKEVEERVSKLTSMVFVAWIFCLAIVLFNWLVTYYNFRKERKI